MPRVPNHDAELARLTAVSISSWTKADAQTPFQFIILEIKR